MKTSNRISLVSLILVLSLLFLSSALPIETKLSGYTKMRYTWDQTKEPQSEFSVKDLRLKWTLKITDIATLVAEPNFTSQVVLKEGYIQLNLPNKTTLQFGQLKVPFGYEMPLSGAYLETPTIATVLSKLFPNQTYDQGIRWLPNKVLIIAVVNGVGENAKDNNNSKDLVIRYVNKKDALSYGSSMYFGEQKVGGKDVRKNRYGIDLMWQEKKTVLRGEAIWGKDEDKTSNGWFIQYRYNLPKISYILRHQYYDGVSSYDDKNKKWKLMDEKAWVFGPMFHLDKSTTLSLMYTMKDGEDNDNFVLQLQIIY